MKVIAEIREQDVDPSAPVVDTARFAHRASVRAVVVDHLNRVALLNVSKRGFHKLPGGGIEPGENRIDALTREVLEEIGCNIEILAELGQVTEYRDEWQQVQTSFCYLAKTVGEPQENSLTDKEREDGFEIVWAKDLNNAIATLEADSPNGYDGKRMKPRDLAILGATKAHLNQS